MKYLILFLFTTLFAQAQAPADDPQIYLADPTIFYSRGIYYLYGTVEENPDKGFKVYTSTDEKNWQEKGYALKKGDSFGDWGFWAPQVFEYKKKFYMAYVANEEIAIAVADSPLGPFRQQVKASLQAPVKQIDPFIFFDDDGKIYLYHDRLQNGGRLFVAEMKSDLSAILPETLKECISSDFGWENTSRADWSVCEGPTVLKRGGLYYLFYTANDFRSPDYAVGFATSASPLGPWKKSDANPILSRKDIGVNGTGHGDFYKGKNGTLNYVFHTHYSKTAVAKRRTATIKVSFEKDTGKFQKPVPDFNTFQFLQTRQ
jgi:xylan 1,4-beta-xylosidase